MHNVKTNHLRVQRFRQCLFCIFLLIPFGAMAQDDDLDFSEMSLEDLLNVEVVTASKQAESVWDAPGIIAVITKEEIKAFGPNQLRDVLELAAGINTAYASASWFGTTIRGGDPSPVSSFTHILLLINGRPVRESYNAPP